MTGNTKQISGAAKDRFLDRLILDAAGIPADAARNLAAQAKAQISTMRVRLDPDIDLRPLRGKQPKRAPHPVKAPAVAPEASSLQPEASAASAAAPAAPFDPYAFGLVPVYQREGRDGLLAKLATVSDPTHLRLMAQKQQIALRADLRTGDISVDTLREAIVAAVEKRIAGRNAAAQ